GGHPIHREPGAEVEGQDLLVGQCLAVIPEPLLVIAVIDFPCRLAALALQHVPLLTPDGPTCSSVGFGEGGAVDPAADKALAQLLTPGVSVPRRHAILKVKHQGTEGHGLHPLRRLPANDKLPWRRAGEPWRL